MKKRVRKLLDNLGKEDVIECPRCGEVHQRTWISRWKGKNVSFCEKCNEWFHVLGYAALREAEEEILGQGIQINQTKEKFGVFMIYVGSNTTEEGRVWLADLLEKYAAKYPDLAFWW